MTDATKTAKVRLEMAEGPLYFAGQPPYVRGQVAICNRSAEAIKVKRLGLSGLKLEALGGGQLGTVRVFAKLGPGEQMQMPVRLALQPHTRPGTYRGQLDCGDERRAVTVEVLEKWSLEIVPVRMSFKVREGDRVACTIRVTNVGNMPYKLRSPISAPLQESDGSLGLPLITLRKSDGTALATVLDELSRHLRERTAVSVAVTVKVANLTLKPGETRAVALEFQPPATLEKHRLYIGSVPFENARFRFELEMLDAADTEELKP